MKYVAFLDVLGFKGILKSSHPRAKNLLSVIFETGKAVWEKLNCSSLKAFFVSDSIVISSDNVSKDALSAMLEVVNKICESAFKNNQILIRGAIAKGEYEQQSFHSNDLTLSQELMVGQAYTDAYLLESSIKTVGVVLSKDVYDDYFTYELEYEVIPYDSKNEVYFLNYLNYSFLSNQKNLDCFISLAIESNWLPIYYNTVYFALEKERKKEAWVFFNSIIERIGIVTEKEMNLFIEHAFLEEVIEKFKRRFSSFLIDRVVFNSVSSDDGKSRSKVVGSANSVADYADNYGPRRIMPTYVSDHIDVSKRVLSYLTDNPESTITGISLSLGMTPKVTSRHLSKLRSKGLVQSSTIARNNSALKNVQFFSISRENVEHISPKKK